MNEETSNRINKLMAQMEKIDKAVYPNTFNIQDIGKMFELSNAIGVTLLRELSDIRELMEKKQ